MELYKNEVNNEIIHNPFELQYKQIQVIGSGSFGKVVKCVDLETNEKVAVKIIDISKYSLKYIEKIKSEIHILEQLRHPNIIEFRKYIETHDNLYYVMNYIQHGTLTQFIEHRNNNSKVSV